ncbi:hypothetical protein HanXRQr2_Chr03g0094451 [Helianthus annuus]|uniref:Uncharacterized protein n=1 Tax=Helianthus annuus TaxID=4232 RepID=A0A251V8N7_HELAN|nr:hypothetical protein HanXRQr2_Chr03g0094451 [Helianthus annuus]
MYVSWDSDERLSLSWICRWVWVFKQNHVTEATRERRESLFQRVLLYFMVSLSKQSMLIINTSCVLIVISFLYSISRSVCVLTGIPRLFRHPKQDLVVVRRSVSGQVFSIRSL